MKDRLPDDGRPVTPPWPVILTALTLALISAWLVFMCGWEPWKAFSAVGLTALGIIFALLAALMGFSGPENRSEIWRIFRQTLRDDIDLLLKYFRIKK